MLPFQAVILLNKFLGESINSTRTTQVRLIKELDLMHTNNFEQQIYSKSFIHGMKQ